MTAGGARPDTNSGTARQCSRREWLAALGSVPAASLAGCFESENSVSVLAAGSLAVVLEDVVGPSFQERTGIDYRGEYHGANVVMRMILEETKRPDVAISADVGLLRDRLYPEHASWDVTFAANRVGLAYNPDTDLGARLAADDPDEPWHELLGAAGEGAVAISDPNLDPLGYRAVHMLELAEEYYDLEGLREAVLESAYHEPDEPQLLAGIETGDRAIAVSYENMALDHGLPFYELPAELDFSDPTYAERYESVSYTTDDGYTAHGSPMLYNATVLDSVEDADPGQEFVSFLLEESDLLADNGLAVPDRLPKTNGEMPESLTELTGGVDL